MNTYSIIIPSTFGIEACVKHELLDMGFKNLKVEDGSVEFTGTEEDIARCNLWIRTGSRVLIKLAEFKALTFEELFQGVYGVDWQSIIPQNGRFIINGRSSHSQLSSVPACQSVTEKAVIKKLQTKYPIDKFPKSGERYIIQIALKKDTAIVTLDTSGDPLYKRGYRKAIGTAPLKETMAAAMINLSFWNKNRFLADPCCGSGTIPIEAALMAKNIAPGLNRSFDFEKWNFFNSSLMKEEREKAKKSILKDFTPNIIASDIDGDILTLAKENAERAGVADCITFRQIPFNKFTLTQDYGVCICNPPYGERMGEIKEVEQLYEDMGRLFNSNNTWSAYFLTSHEGFEKIYGKKADRKRKLFNGNIKVDYYQYFGKKIPRERS